MKKIASLVSLAVIAAIFPINTFASETLADNLMKGNKLVAVVVVLVIILSGILFFLWSLERRVKKMEEDINH
jgi:formate hydrogenlyase subunit 3/multisubunit Na+/H+ antiporter MnhD subunit